VRGATWNVTLAVISGFTARPARMLTRTDDRFRAIGRWKNLPQPPCKPVHRGLQLHFR
jgi:hypothetical protein